MTETQVSTRLRLTVMNLASGAVGLPDDPDSHHFLYMRDGSADIEQDAGRATLAPGHGQFVQGLLRVDKGAVAWLFAVTPFDSVPDLGELVLSEPVNLAFTSPMILRADRIESPAGMQTPRHGHRGPGMRRLVEGLLRAQVGGRIETVHPGEAWFETGTEPVIGTNLGPADTVFVRVMVLPVELEGGKSSFVPMNSEVAGRPLSVSNILFGEVRV